MSRTGPRFLSYRDTWIPLHEGGNLGKRLGLRQSSGFGGRRSQVQVG